MQIQARLGELRLQPGPGQDNVAGSGMTPDEAAEWRRLNLQLVYLLESREQALKDLKTLRHEVPADPGRSAWKGFSGNPPYPLAALVNLYDHIYALRSEVDALEVQRALREANLNTFLKAREATEKQLRQAEDLLTKSAGKESAVRARRQRDLARLRNEVNSEGALAEDVAQLLAAEKIRSKRKELQSLEEQYRSRGGRQSPLTREDLDRKLAELEARRKDREKLLAAAIQEERSAKAALEKARTGRPKTGGETERIRLETASSKIGIYQGSIKIVNFEEALWQDRYRLGQVEDLGELREKRAEVDKALKQLGSWKEAFGKTAFSYAPLIGSENEKLRSGTLSKEEEGSVRSRVAAYQERQNLWGQVVQALNQVERVATRWKEDLEYRVEHVATAARARETGRSLLSVFGKLWNTELYVAEETTVIGGQKIVRPFSVTVGKVGKALIVLLAGLWGARRLGEPAEAPRRPALRHGRVPHEPDRKEMVLLHLPPPPRLLAGLREHPAGRLRLLRRHPGHRHRLRGPAPHRELHQQHHPDVRPDHLRGGHRGDGGAVRPGEVHRPAELEHPAVRRGGGARPEQPVPGAEGDELDAVGPEGALRDRRGRGVRLPDAGNVRADPRRRPGGRPRPGVAGTGGDLRETSGTTR